MVLLSKQHNHSLPSLSLVETDFDVEELSIPSISQEMDTSSAYIPVAETGTTTQPRGSYLAKSRKREQRSSPVQSPLKLTMQIPGTKG